MRRTGGVVLAVGLAFSPLAAGAQEADAKSGDRAWARIDDASTARDLADAMVCGDPARRRKQQRLDRRFNAIVKRHNALYGTVDRMPAHVFIDGEVCGPHDGFRMNWRAAMKSLDAAEALLREAAP